MTKMYSPNVLVAVDHADQIFDWRMNGVSYEEIASRLGISIGTVIKSVNDEVQKRRPSDAAVNEMRLILAHRAEKLWAIAFAEAEEGSLPAIDRCLNILKTQASLYGINTVTVSTEEKEESTEERKMIIELKYVDSH